MILSESSESQSRIERLGRTILDIPRRITEPSNEIVDEGTRRKARFLSVALFTGPLVFPVLQITSEVTYGIPYYSFSAVFLAALYLLSRTTHVELASVITITFAAGLPVLILILNPIWENEALPIQMLTWPVLVALIGSQLLTAKREGVLVIGMSTVLVMVSWLHPGIDFSQAIELISVAFVLQGLVWITSWTTEYYSISLEESNRNLAARRRELEIYTGLLKHDLANDIQMILGSLELSQMTINNPKKCASFLESTLAAAERMKSLIHIFSISEDELDNDIMTIIELICQRAQITFKGMLITLDIKEEVRDQPEFYGRLIALAFENLLRNSDQHAGNAPNVRITGSLIKNHLEIIFEDDGPGVPEEIRDKLFGRGVTTGDKGRGLGLYLTRKIIESEGGSISLTDNGRPGCCFKIRLPLH